MKPKYWLSWKNIGIHRVEWIPLAFNGACLPYRGFEGKMYLYYLIYDVTIHRTKTVSRVWGVLRHFLRRGGEQVSTEGLTRSYYWNSQWTPI